MISSFSEARMPAEWQAHRTIWLAWPSHEHLWAENLAPARREFVDLCQALLEGDELDILVPDAEHLGMAQKSLPTAGIRFHIVPFGDIWLRDTACLFVKTKEQKIHARCFKFNGWGKKYQLPHDNQVASKVAQLAQVPLTQTEIVAEGGAIEVDGLGNGLTTEQCLLNPNRNPHLSREQIEQHLFDSLGIANLVWLKRGLVNDHTDGHVDTLARFVAPGKVVCLRGRPDDPNFGILEEIYSDLSAAKNRQGAKFEVYAIPSAGRILGSQGEVMPASYLNFLIGNGTVIVPTYGSAQDEAAVGELRNIFSGLAQPKRKVIGLSARAILSGGGAFHCISQQEPL